MKRSILFCIVLFGLVLTACAAKPAASIGSIQIFNPRATRAIKDGTSGAFMLIKNTGSQPDKLIKVDCMVSMMSGIHETKMDNEVMTITEIPALDIPANGQVDLKDGSYHIMLMNVNHFQF